MAMDKKPHLHYDEETLRKSTDSEKAEDFDMPLKDKDALLDSNHLRNPVSWLVKRIRHTSIGKDRTIGGVRISDGREDGAVAYYTYMKFKGCDSKIAILLDVTDKDPRWDAIGMYTALSRAISQVYVLRKVV